MDFLKSAVASAISKEPPFPYSELDEVSDDFPEEFFCVKVLPELLKSIEFGGGGPKVFASVMKIGKKLSDEEWESRITPVSGFTDVAPLVREQTVKAVLTIITKLSDRTINGELLKQVRDQANKCFDVYLQRIRKYGNSLPDTVLPTSATASGNGAVPRMGTPQNDNAGWAGWAISSFTNKLATASGDMQSNAATAHPPKLDRSSSVPPPADTTRPAKISASASTLHRQAVTGTSTPAAVETSTDQYFPNPIDDDQEVDEAWGEMADDDFFDASSEPKPSNAPAINFDDGGEPDFEGWLKAQAQARTKTSLPKGLAKPAAVVRTTTTGSVGSGAGPKKLASIAAKPKAPVAKTISTKPTETEDDWGDAWD
ncbi:hypothetical protein P7C71_g873, partial [Lecanoromycetidae sp. Uapishka_2]